MTWFEITVENSVGIQGKHYVEAYFPSSVIESEQAAGFTVLAIREWSTKQFPNIRQLQF